MYVGFHPNDKCLQSKLALNFDLACSVCIDTMADLSMLLSLQTMTMKTSISFEGKF